MTYEVSYRIGSKGSYFRVEHRRFDTCFIGDVLTYKTLENSYKGGVQEFLKDCLYLNETESVLIRDQIEKWQEQVYHTIKTTVED
jgi:hypothetical protein